MVGRLHQFTTFKPEATVVGSYWTHGQDKKRFVRNDWLVWRVCRHLVMYSPFSFFWSYDLCFRVCMFSCRIFTQSHYVGNCLFFQQQNKLSWPWKKKNQLDFTITSWTLLEISAMCFVYGYSDFLVPWDTRNVTVLESHQRFYSLLELEGTQYFRITKKWKYLAEG